jgi:hypothetical protein
MKIIELLNKIANGEEVPKKIKYKNNILYYDDDYTKEYPPTFNYYDEEGNNGLIEGWLCQYINDEVEIIEEDKKDEEIELYVNGEKVDITDIYEPLKQGEFFYKENGKWYIHKLKNVSFAIEEDKKIEKIDLDSLLGIGFYEGKQTLAGKINEIIDHINKEND